jgi:hypothetical protein
VLFAKGATAVGFLYSDVAYLEKICCSSRRVLDERFAYAYVHIFFHIHLPIFHTLLVTFYNFVYDMFMFNCANYVSVRMVLISFGTLLCRKKIT